MLNTIMTSPSDNDPHNAAYRLQTTIDGLRGTREVAEPKIAEAIRELEDALRDVLGPSGRLLGLPNLGDNELRISGLVIRSPRKDRIRYPDPGQSTNVLILRPEGNLAIAEVSSNIDPQNPTEDDVSVDIRPVRDNEFIASDLRCVVETVEQAIRIHLGKVERTTDQWSEAGRLADQLLYVLQGDDDDDDRR